MRFKEGEGEIERESEKYSQVFKVWQIFKSLWVDVGQTFRITYLSERTDKSKMFPKQP